MKVKRTGDACVVAGIKVESGQVVDLPADVVKSLLRQTARWAPVAQAAKKNTEA